MKDRAIEKVVLARIRDAPANSRKQTVMTLMHDTSKHARTSGGPENQESPCAFIKLMLEREMDVSVR